MNNLFWDEIARTPISKLIKNYPKPSEARFTSSSQIKLWLGRQLGEVILRPTYNDRSKKIELSAKKKAILEIMNIMGVGEDLANKYLNLNQEGFFEKEKKETLVEYWLRRTRIDLNEYKTILKLMPQEKEMVL